MLTKHPKANLRSFYIVFIEIGLIVSLLVMIAATRAPLQTHAPTVSDVVYEPDIEIIIDVPITVDEIPPAPPRPQIPIPVSDDQLIEDIIEFPDFDFDSESLPLPPPPPLEDDEEKLHNYIGVEIKPEMKGGMQAFYAQITYPKVAKIAGIEGRVVVQFVVDKEGNVTKPEVIRGIGGGCDEEVLRVLKLTKFSPAIQNGRFVPVKMTQNVRFSLQN